MRREEGDRKGRGGEDLACLGNKTTAMYVNEETGMWLFLYGIAFFSQLSVLVMVVVMSAVRRK